MRTFSFGFGTPWAYPLFILAPSLPSHPAQFSLDFLQKRYSDTSWCGVIKRFLRRLHFNLIFALHMQPRPLKSFGKRSLMPSAISDTAPTLGTGSNAKQADLPSNCVSKFLTPRKQLRFVTGPLTVTSATASSLNVSVTPLTLMYFPFMLLISPRKKPSLSWSFLSCPLG